VGAIVFMPNSASMPVVSQAAIDELIAFSEKLGSHGEEGNLSVGLRDGPIAGTHTTIEDIRERREIVESIIEWCRQHTEIIRPHSLVEMNRAEREKRSAVLGDLLLETTLLAQEFNGAVVCDDDAFKNLLMSEYKIKSFNTFQWAVRGFSNQEITHDQLDTHDQLEHLSLQLIMANHVFIPACLNTFAKSFEYSEFQIRKPFTVAVKGQLILNPLLAAANVVRFVKGLYLNSGLVLTRDQVILFVLTELVAHQQFPLIKRTMQILIPNEFKLMPIQAESFLNLLGGF
jgi:hypothetical protein